MSIRHIKKVLDLELTTTPKLVLIVFADCANEFGICWPGIKLVAARASVSERTVKRLIKTFSKQGLLVSRPRFGRSGRQLSSEYQIFPSQNICEAMSPLGDFAEQQGVTPLAVRGDTSVTQTTTEPINNLYNNHLILPKTLTKLEQSSALKIVSKLANDDAQSVLDELAGRISKGQVRNPTSYLRMLVKLQNEGEFIPELSHTVAQKRLRQQMITEAPTAAHKVSAEEYARHMEEMRRALNRRISLVN